MSAAAYRVGIVGSSFGGAVHAPAFTAQGRFEVVALASPIRATEVARARRIPHAFASVDEMLAGVKLDVVAIASPPFDHLPSVRAALGAGLHVLCEKPFALNVRDAQEMVTLAERAGTTCALAHEFRYTPQSQALHELVRNGHLGALRAIEVHIAARLLRADVERPNSWWFERARGGGLTGAYLSHLTDLANFLAGSPPVRATGFERTAIPERHAGGVAFTSDVADGAFATIDYGGGLIASVSVDGTRVTDSTTIAIHGETSTAVASGTSLLDLQTFVVDDEETSELELAPQAHENLRAAHINLPAFVTLLDAFAATLDGKPVQLPTFADGLATQRVLEAIGYRA